MASTNNEVRIIGGQWRGRKLKFPAHAGLRPTLGRVRETLFNWLAPLISDARCLDLYAGSGALGLEALSRGAAEVTFVERDRKAAASLRANLTRLGARAVVREEPARRFLSRSEALYDVIFVDPPFDEPFFEQDLALLRQRLTRPDGRLYLERGRGEPMPDSCARLKQGTAGDCQFALYPPYAPPESAPPA
jgi:16S rRNA (guanine966-N2)-methyltransferase